MGNVCCRIFKEQIDLVLQLPEKERAEVLYKSILYAFNQIENQIDNQNENAYVSVSVSESISVLGKTVFSLLSKNITCKEFSNNYGGRRKNAGAKKQTPVQINLTPQPTNTFTPPTEEQVLEYARQQNECAGIGGFACPDDTAQAFYDYYTGIGWHLPNDAHTPILDWKPFLRKWATNPKYKPKEEPEEEWHL